MQLLATMALAVAALCQHVCAAAWTITSSDATQPEDIQGPHQTYVKVWTVTGSQPLRALSFHAAGFVFVDYDATLNGAATNASTEAPEPEAPAAPVAGSAIGSDVSVAVSVDHADDNDVVVDKVLAKVAFSGNCTKLLDALELVERQGEGALSVHFKNADFSGYGYLLTQVLVGEKQGLSELVNDGSSSVYVSENVIAATDADAEVTLKANGDGNVFVTAPLTAYTLKSLSTKVSGSGTLQFAAQSVLLGDELTTRISGDGDIAVVSETVDVANTISSKISAFGRVFVQADAVKTFKLKSTITGDGDVTVSTNGSCVTQKIEITGSGTVATGSIACEDTTVRVTGDGAVLLQTSHKLVVPHSGKVQYVGTAPREITDGRQHKKPKHYHRRGWFSWGNGHDDDDDDDDSEEEGVPKGVTQTPANTYETYTLRDAPAREPTFVVLELRKNWWGYEPNARVMISIVGVDIGGWFVSNTQALAARVQNQHLIVRGLFFVGFVAVALSTVVITLHKLVVARRRRQYQPLLQVVTAN